MDGSPPDSSVHGILQARILEWVAITFSRGSSRPRDQIQVSCLSGRLFTQMNADSHNPVSLKWELWTFWKMLKHFSLSPFFTPSLLFTTLQGQRRVQLTCLGKSKVSCGRSAAQVNTRISSLPARWGDHWAAVCPGTPIPTPTKAWLCEFRSPGWLWRPAFRSGSGCRS